jgi:hypothetical protein
MRTLQESLLHADERINRHPETTFLVPVDRKRATPPAPFHVIQLVHLIARFLDDDKMLYKKYLATFLGMNYEKNEPVKCEPAESEPAENESAENEPEQNIPAQKKPKNPQNSVALLASTCSTLFSFLCLSHDVHERPDFHRRFALLMKLVKENSEIYYNPDPGCRVSLLQSQQAVLAQLNKQREPKIERIKTSLDSQLRFVLEISSDDLLRLEYILFPAHSNRQKAKALIQIITKDRALKLFVCALLTITLLKLVHYLITQCPLISLSTLYANCGTLPDFSDDGVLTVGVTERMRMNHWFAKNCSSEIFCENFMQNLTATVQFIAMLNLTSNLSATVFSQAAPLCETSCQSSGNFASWNVSDMSEIFRDYPDSTGNTLAILGTFIAIAPCFLYGVFNVLALMLDVLSRLSLGKRGTEQGMRCSLFVFPKKEVTTVTTDVDRVVEYGYFAGF